MPLPTIYNTGTASVANGATTLTIVGAVSNAIYAGDLFCDPAQPLVPPQRIASVTGGGVYELAVGWPGTAMTSDPYEVRITPDSVRVQERTREVLEALGQRGLPQGGDAGQVLGKVSGDDYAVAWVDDEVGGGGAASDIAFTPTGDLTSTDTQAAIAEVNGKIAAAAAGVARRGTVRAATTANITIATALNNGDSLDGVTLATGDLVLVKNQAAPAENGVYVVGTSPARSTEFDTYNEHPGALIVVQEGTALADSFWYCTSNAGGTLGTTGIVFAQLSLTPADGSITYAKMAAGVIRETLAANRTYYVRTDGSDSNTGLANTSGGAFLTLQKAWNTVAALDLSTFSATIKVENGTYSAGLNMSAMPLGGSGITIEGNTASPANVHVSLAGSCFLVSSALPCPLTIKGFKTTFSSTGGSAVRVSAPGRVTASNMELAGGSTGGFTGAYRADDPGAILMISTGQLISGGMSCLAQAIYGGIVLFFGITVTLTGTPAFSWITVGAQSMGLVELVGVTFSGAATGTRYNTSTGGGINTGGGGASFIPGNAAGTATAPGWYV
ncbi:hypothetical protein [Devosia sp. A16]|uniref:hypothetical protein n=1 Tax=Devosia sp. A16 TaxID=1736675 RepID=UPI0006D76D29|nr:hypothetical protein [Devosia sp. A16]